LFIMSDDSPVLSESIVMQSREKFLCNGNSCLAHTNDSNWTCMTRYVLGLEKDLVNMNDNENGTGIWTSNRRGGIIKIYNRTIDCFFK
jgi:hypothetical protein